MKATIQQREQVIELASQKASQIDEFLSNVREIAKRFEAMGPIELGAVGTRRYAVKGVSDGGYEIVPLLLVKFKEGDKNVELLLSAADAARKDVFVQDNPHMHFLSAGFEDARRFVRDLPMLCNNIMNFLGEFEKEKAIAQKIANALRS